MRPTLLLAALLAAVAATATPASAAAPGEREATARTAACTTGACARRKARRLLADKVLIRFTDTATASLDQRLHLCDGGAYVYDSVSYIPEAGSSVQRSTGAWKVVSARLGKRGRGSAKVRGTPDDGSAPTTVKITFDGAETRLDGALVSVEASDLC